MSKLILMVGLPASGKSTYAENYVAEHSNTILYSSDTIRKELLGDERDQSNNDLVFRALYKRAKESLLIGLDVVIDATNVSMKDRKRTLSNFERMEIERECVFIATPYEICIERDANRERTVGESVIKKFLYKFEVPMPFEGFDEIKYVCEYENYYNIDSIMHLAYSFDQRNPHHKYTVGAHCSECRKLLKDRTSDNNLIEAGYYHDIGKLFTQSIDYQIIAHYYQHHNVGAYILACCMFDPEVVFYVNYHMNVFNWKEEKTRQKYLQLFGIDRFDNLLLLNECDRIASGS